MTAARRADFDPVNLSYDGLAFAQLAFAVLGVLAISSEYATGLIRTTFTAPARRRIVLAVPAKWNLWAAGNSLISSHPKTAYQPSTALAALVCATYVLAILGAAFTLINRGDA